MTKPYLREFLKQYSKGDLLNILNLIQEKEGSLSEDNLRYVSGKIGVPLAQLYSAASFYAFFNLEKPSKNTIRICNSPSCYLNGSTDLLTEITRITGLKPGQRNKRYSFEIVQCIGCCDKAPAMMLNSKVHGNLTDTKLRRLLK